MTIADPIPPTPSLEAPDPAVKAFRREGLGYVWDIARHQLVFRADYLHRSRDAVTASIAIESSAPGVMPHVYRGKLGLESTTSQRDLVKHLERLTGLRDSDEADGKPWLKMVQAWCSALLKAEENTVTVVEVGNLPPREHPADLVERLLPAGKPTILYGDSSAGKGWLATAMAVCVETGQPFGTLKVTPGHVLYLDWEDDEWTFNDRVRAVARGMGLSTMPTLAYSAMRGPFKRHYRAVAQLVAKRGYDVLVLDSIGLAAGTVGERGSYEDVAIDLFDQLRTMSVAALLIDHVNSDGRSTKDGVPDKSLGSIYKRALARSQWFVKKDQDAESSVLHLGLFQTKTNHTATSKPLGFRVSFSGDGDTLSARLESEDLRESDTLSRALPVWERIRDYLARVGKASGRDIADQLDLSQDVVRVECGRRKTVFLRVGEKEWGLLAREPGSNVTRFRSPYRDDGEALSDDDLPFG